MDVTKSMHIYDEHHKRDREILRQPQQIYTFQIKYKIQEKTWKMLSVRSDSLMSKKNNNYKDNFDNSIFNKPFS